MLGFRAKQHNGHEHDGNFQGESGPYGQGLHKEARVFHMVALSERFSLPLQQR